MHRNSWYLWGVCDRPHIKFCVYNGDRKTDLSCQKISELLYSYGNVSRKPLDGITTGYTSSTGDRNVASRDALKDLPVLQQNLADLTELAGKGFTTPVRIGTRSHLRFMLASFAVKQIEHSRSLLKLESSIDTVLITRSMLEGLAQLLWATKRPRRRPLMWRAFAFVLDWRLLQEQRSQGLTIDPVIERHTRRGIKRYGNWFLKKEARRALAAGKPLPKDPYSKNWYGERETDILRDVGGETLLEGVYAPFSEWHHWRPGAFGRLLSFDKGTSTFSMATWDPNQLATALATGFLCLWQTMQLFNARCRLGIGHDLQWLRRRQPTLR